MYSYKDITHPSSHNTNTRFLAIAGFSLNGPVNTPFLINKDVEPIQVLGDCRLAESVSMAREYGIEPLILRMNGSHAECEIVHEERGVPILRFTTLEATDECNNMLIHLFPTHLVVEGIYSQFAYYFDDYLNVDELSAAIKKDLYFSKGEVDVEVLEKSAPLNTLCKTERFIPFENANDGFHYVANYDGLDLDELITNQVKLLRELFLEDIEEGTYCTGELSGFPIDTLLFTDIPFERAPKDLIDILGSFAYSKTREQNIFCSVVLGSDQINGDRYDEEGNDLYQEQLEILLQNAPYAIEETRHKEHVEVVVGVQNSILPTKDYMPCATSYACMRYNLPQLSISATNQPLEHVNMTWNQELLKDEVAQINKSGYICIVPSIRKGFVPFSSKNIHPENTLFSKPNNLRSVRSDLAKITGFFEPYIGEPFSFGLLQTLITEVEDFIDELLDDHPIYQDIQLELLDFSMHHFKISLTFKLCGEIEIVRSTLNYESSKEVTVEW